MKELAAIEKTCTQIADEFDRKLNSARQAGKKIEIDWLEHQILVNDLAYFILIWGQLEARINDHCTKAIRKRLNSSNWQSHRAWDAFDPDNLRARFEDRAALVLDRRNIKSEACRRTIRYYGQRNRVAHGNSLAMGIDVQFIITDIYQIVSELGN